MRADLDVAVGWLRTWRPSPPWTVVEIDPTPKSAPAFARTFTAVEDLRAYLESRDGVMNLYWIPNDAVPGILTTPRKDEVINLRAIYVDLDLPKDGSVADEGELLGRLRALVPPPPLIIFSGGGFQAFWPLAEPLPAAEHADRAELIGRTIARELRSDAVQNVNRLMRLPGTVNLPTAVKRARGRTEPRLSHVVEADWSRTWSMEADPVPHLPEGYWGAEGPRPRSLGELPDRLARLMRTGDAQRWNGDRSDLTWYVINDLMRLGWADEDILPFLLDRTYGVSAHCLAQRGPTDYARKQIGNARRLAEKDWRRNRLGAINGAAPANLRRAFDEMRLRFFHDEFTGKDLYVNGSARPKLLSDRDEAAIRVEINDRFDFRPDRESLRDVIVTLASAAPVHPVREYLAGLVWDGVPRLDTWLVRLARSTLDNAFVRAAGRLILVGAVRRVRAPGCKFDNMLVLINAHQGTNKSMAVGALAVKQEWFTDSLPLHVNPQQTIEVLEGKWIVECSELQGMRRADVDSVKSFLSRQVDKARPAYGHHAVEVPRQCVFFGTTNSDAFLRDPENRRFWPVWVGEIDVAGLIAERDQLWAEAAAAEGLVGGNVELDRSLWPLAAVHQEAAAVGDVWIDLLSEALGSLEGRVAVLDVWKILSPDPTARRGHDEGMRLTEAMRALGWLRELQRVEGVPRRCFVKGASRASVYVHRDPITGEVTVGNDPAPSGAGDFPW